MSKKVSPGQVLGGLKVSTTVPFDPAKFINESWAFWKGPKDSDGLKGEEERDKAALTLQEVDFEKSDLLTCLERGESSITGEEKLIRLRKLGRPLYGSTQFMGLWQDYQQNKSQSVLKRLYQQKGVEYIDFFGDILRDPDGGRCVLFLFRCGDRSWSWDYDWLGGDWSNWHDCHFTAVAQQASS